LYRALMLITLALLPARADAAARIAESGRYICADGSSLRFDRRGYGPVLIRDGRQTRLSQRWVFSGFRFTAPGLVLRGRGREGEKTLLYARKGLPELSCNAVPAGTSPGILTGTLTGRLTLPPGARIEIRLTSSGRSTAATRLRPGRRTLPLDWWLAYPATTRSGSLSAVALTPRGHIIARTARPVPLPSAPPRRHATAVLELK
jgi:hypothetical protein